MARNRRMMPSYDIVARLPCVNHVRNEFRRMLEVAVNRDDRISAGGPKSRLDRGFFAEIARETDAFHRSVFSLEGRNSIPCPVRTSIVYENNLASVFRKLLPDGDNRLVERKNVPFFVEDGNNDGERALYSARACRRHNVLIIPALYEKSFAGRDKILGQFFIAKTFREGHDIVYDDAGPAVFIYGRKRESELLESREKLQRRTSKALYGFRMELKQYDERGISLYGLFHAFQRKRFGSFYVHLKYVNSGMSQRFERVVQGIGNHGFGSASVSLIAERMGCLVVAKE